MPALQSPPCFGFTPVLPPARSRRGEASQPGRTGVAARSRCPGDTPAPPRTAPARPPPPPRPRERSATAVRCLPHSRLLLLLHDPRGTPGRAYGNELPPAPAPSDAPPPPWAARAPPARAVRPLRAEPLPPAAPGPPHSPRPAPRTARTSGRNRIRIRSSRSSPGARPRPQLMSPRPWVLHGPGASASSPGGREGEEPRAGQSAGPGGGRLGCLRAGARPYRHRPYRPRPPRGPHPQRGLFPARPHCPQNPLFSSFFFLIFPFFFFCFFLSSLAQPLSFPGAPPLPRPGRWQG